MNIPTVRSAALSAAAIACLSLSACGSSSQLHTASQPAASPVANGVDSTSPAQEVEDIAIQDTDLPDTQQRQLLDGGDQVAGQVTLDNCGYKFSTETYRVARREYAVLDANGQSAIGNEIVAYDSAVHAAQAITEWNAAATECPTTPFRSAVAGVPPITATVLSNRRDVTWLPVRPNIVTVERQHAPDVGTLYGTAMLQQHGRFLDIVYVSTHPTPTRDVVTEATRLARATGKRLLAES